MTALSRLIGQFLPAQLVPYALCLIYVLLSVAVVLSLGNRGVDNLYLDVHD